MQVMRIDHVHLEVADREAAADWYRHVPGLQRNAQLGFWAEDPMGPLVLNAGDGEPALSLFARASKEVTRDATIAFKVDGASFPAFRARLEDLKLMNKHHTAVTKADIVDHQCAWSVYFVDPDGNGLELTTCDHAPVRKALR